MKYEWLRAYLIVLISWYSVWYWVKTEQIILATDKQISNFIFREIYRNIVFQTVSFFYNLEYQFILFYLYVYLCFLKLYDIAPLIGSLRA